LTYTFEDWKSGAPFPKGWDSADAVDDGWTKQQIIDFMRSTVRAFLAPVETEEPERRPFAVEQIKPEEQPRPSAEIHHLPPPARPVEMQADWCARLVTTEKGDAKPAILANWMEALENHATMVGVFMFDEFRNEIVLQARPPWATGDEWEPRPLRDSDYTNACMWLETKMLFTPSPSKVMPAVHVVADRNRFDRLREYLLGLEWDGKSRCDIFLPGYLGIVDSNYSRTTGAKYLISAVARALSPGCKVDTMLILEGGQGKRKSSAWAKLFGDFFTDQLSDIGHKDAQMEMAGVWGIEVAEMHTFGRAEANLVKKFMTSTSDRYRPPYGRSVVEVKRRSVLCGTMNPDGNPPFSDSTGARRFWSHEVGTIMLDMIERDRDQIWAEAVQLWMGGANHWFEQEGGDVQEEQLARTAIDVWTDLIAEACEYKNTVSQGAIIKSLAIPAKEQSAGTAMRIGRIMKQIGFERQIRMKGVVQQVMYSRIEKVQEDDEEQAAW